jgi:hypothetical protein
MSAAMSMTVPLMNDVEIPDDFFAAIESGQRTISVPVESADCVISAVMVVTMTLTMLGAP